MSVKQSVGRSIIFYGAGANAEKNLAKWEAEGLIPVCFVDADTEKQHTLFHNSNYEILPLQEAISKYPNYMLYITLVPANIREVHKQLLGLGVPQERLFFCDSSIEYRKGCNYINSFLQISVSPNTLYLRCCCYQSVPFYFHGTELEGIIKSYLTFTQYRKELINKLRNNVPCECDGCTALHYDYWSNDININKLTMDGGFNGERCNVKCCYCHAEGSQKASRLDNSWSYFDILNEIMAYLPDGLTFSPAASEFTISPHKNEIFNIMDKRHWRGNFLSSGLLFDSRIADMMQENRATMHISVDAGTRETFAKVKGIDYWDKLNQNLAKYAEAGLGLTLKYIFLENINDNIADVDGFIAISRKYVNSVYLSIDTNKTKSGTALSKNMYDMMMRFIVQARNAKLRSFIVWDRFNGNPELVKSMKEIILKAQE